MSRLFALSDFGKSKVLAVQDFTLLAVRAVQNLFTRPRYVNDTVIQLDVIGVGSLPIVILTGFFTGAVLALQTSSTLQQFGEITLTGQLVAKSLVRELGPVLSSLMVAGRIATGIASEIGSMLVSEQIDAMRALGTDPTKKLVTPRVVAAVIALPLLTIISDFVGLCGGFMVSFFIIRMDAIQYWTSAYQSLHFADIFQGMTKPFLFGFIVAMVGSYFGMSTKGGTIGVGRSTTEAMVVSSVLIIASDFFITRLLMAFLM